MIEYYVIVDMEELKFLTHDPDGAPTWEDYFNRFTLEQAGTLVSELQDEYNDRDRFFIFQIYNEWINGKINNSNSFIDYMNPVRIEG